MLYCAGKCGWPALLVDAGGVIFAGEPKTHPKRLAPWWSGKTPAGRDLGRRFWPVRPNNFSRLGTFTHGLGGMKLLNQGGGVAFVFGSFAPSQKTDEYFVLQLYCPNSTPPAAAARRNHFRPQTKLDCALQLARTMRA